MRECINEVIMVKKLMPLQILSPWPNIMKSGRATIQHKH